MSLSIRCKNILQALEDGRPLDVPPFGKLAMTENGEVGFVAERNGVEIVLVDGLSGILLNNFLKAVAEMSEDDMTIITGNNALQKIRKTR
jgi:hypothetical protein